MIWWYIIDYDNSYEIKLNHSLDKYSSILSNLNNEQQEAITNALSADQFYLIWGAAWTGKATLIVSMLKILD